MAVIHRAAHPFPARAYVGMAAIGTKVYMAGGTILEGPDIDTHTSAFLEWDQASNTWSAKASLPDVNGRAEGRLAAIGTKLYYIGGTNNWEPYAYTTLTEWDQGTNTWTEKAAMPGPRLSPSIGVIGTKLYVAGGSDGSTGAKNTLYEWDQGSNTWTTKAPMPAVKYAVSGAAVGGKLYVIHGSGNKTLYVWDQSTNTWTAEPNGPSFYVQGRDHAASTVMDGSVLQFGGSGENGYETTVASYGALDGWVGETQLDVGMAGHGAATIGSSVFLAGGLMNTYSRILREWMRDAPPPPSSPVVAWAVGAA